MELFSICLVKIIPLYMYIFLGYFAGKWLDASRETVARIMFYIINPIVIFNGVSHAPLNVEVLSLPLLVFFISTFLCLIFYRYSKTIWSDTSRNLIAFTVGCGNTGYFGLPMAILLFSEEGQGIYIMAMLGVTFYENSIGYYIFSGSKGSLKECLLKLLKVPAFTALLLGIVANALHLPSNIEIFSEFVSHIKGAYTVLGMMIIGLGLSSMTRFELDYKFISLAFLARVIIWPILMLAIILLDTHLLHFFDQTTYNALMLISIVPLGANTVIFASLLKRHPEKAATAVLLSTLFALIYVPFMANYFIKACAYP